MIPMEDMSSAILLLAQSAQDAAGSPDNPCVCVCVCVCVCMRERERDRQTDRDRQTERPYALHPTSHTLHTTHYTLNPRLLMEDMSSAVLLLAQSAQDAAGSPSPHTLLHFTETSPDLSGFPLQYPKENSNVATVLPSVASVDYSPRTTLYMTLSSSSPSRPRTPLVAPTPRRSVCVCVCVRERER